MRLMRTPSVGWDRMSEHQRKEQIKNKNANSVKNIARAEFLSLCGLDPGKFKPRPLLTAWRTQVGPAATSGSCQERTLVSDGHVWINWRDLNNDLTGSAP